MANASFSADPATMTADERRSDNYKFAMWLYLASEVVIFTVFIGAYAVMRLNEPAIVKQVHEEANILLVTLNTFLLLTSSWTMVMGLREIKKNNPAGLIRWFAYTVILGVIFLGGQWIEYNELAHLGITINFTDNEWQTFGAHFYLPTFFHGLHVLVGVIWAGLIMRNAGRGGYNAQRYVGVEVFGLYWHFVDVVWIILFTVIYLV